MSTRFQTLVRMCTAAALVSSLAAGCSHGPAPTDGDRLANSSPAHARLVASERVAMGSSLRITAWTRDEPAAMRAFDDVFAEFARLEKLMSTWVPGSDVSRVNRAAGVEPVPVHQDLLEILEASAQISEWTGGKFDITFGALAGLWKFDHDQDNVIPDMREVRRRLPLIDYRAVEIDRRAGTAFLRRSRMSIHLGGIGKGYAIDRGAAILRARGLADFMIQSGGDIYVAGRRDGRPWRLAIQDPRGAPEQIFAELDLSDGTFSTSGDYERFFMRNGRRFHHILDPDTGEPARGARSATIVTSRAVVADGLSTGVFILGADAGMALLERLPGVEGVIVSSRNEVLVSSGLKNKLRIVAPPTDKP